MEEWITEQYQNMGLSFKTTEKLYHAQSPYQAIDVLDTVAYGRLLLLDGAVMTTDRDEFVYHEMISHVPMLVHPCPKRVLVIGGGDGGTVRELVKHPEVETVVLCEIDGLVIEACKTYFPKIASQLEHPKVTVKVGDGVAYMAEEASGFDLIIIDSTDPIGPGEGLFTEAFYRNAYNALNPDGILVAQTESPFLNAELIQKIYPIYERIFPIVRMYTGHIPTYPSGFWTWAFCSRQYGPELPQIHQSRIHTIEKTCQYYHAAMHEASFVLPQFLKALLSPPVAAAK
jgi:spermidine synthase